MREVWYSDMSDRYDTAPENDCPIYVVNDRYTILFPGKIGNQRYRTKGHRHTDGSSERYICHSGRGHLIEIADGEKRLRIFESGSEYDIDPHSYHYVRNCSDGPLVFETIGSNCEKDYTVVE